MVPRLDAIAGRAGEGGHGWARESRMKLPRRVQVTLIVAPLSAGLVAMAGMPPSFSPAPYTMKLDLRALTLRAVKAEIVEHRGRRAIHLADRQASQTADVDSMAVLNDSDFQDGTIELQIAGT